MIRALPFFSVLSLPVLVVLGVWLGEGWAFLAAGAVYVGIPLLDLIGGRDETNHEDPGPAWLYDFPLYAWLPMQVATMVWTLQHLALGDPSWVTLVGAVVSLGAVNGAGGINVSHELMHRSQPFPRAAAEVLLQLSCYPQFAVEHVLGHHRNVATPKDAAWCRMGQSLYTYVPSSVARGLISAWRLEGARVAKKQIGALSLRNRRFRYPLGFALVAGAITLTLGWQGLVLYLAQGAVAIFLLETINYLEHYGLRRRELAPGRYERVQPWHSWNANHRITNWLLFNLARHSDHHFLASRPYRALRHYEDVPQLPAGYSAMVLVALVPPLWRRIMDPRVEAWNARREEPAPAAPVPLAA